MAQLLIGNRIINSPLMSIIRKIRQESNYQYFHDVQDKGDYIRVTCPYHKNGQEQHPSMSIFINDSNTEYKTGNFNCFTCGESGSLPKLVSHCLGLNIDEAKDWLVSNFSDEIVVDDDKISELLRSVTKDFDALTSTSTKTTNTYLNPEELSQYNFYHPYMWKRKLSKEVVDRFSIGYDENLNAITFPVWDVSNNLVMVTKRCVDNKTFFIPKDVDKPVYLLNFAVKDGLDTVYVCESQINTLYCYTLGMPAIGLFGTGDPYQYSILKKVGIKHYILALDGDVAGRKGIHRFIKNFEKTSFIDVLVLPEGKDINDLSKEEINKLPLLTSQEWLNQYINI